MKLTRRLPYAEDFWFRMDAAPTAWHPDVLRQRSITPAAVNGAQEHFVDASEGTAIHETIAGMDAFYTLLKQAQREGLHGRAHEVVLTASDPLINAQCGALALAMVQVCMDAHDGSEPDGVPRVHVGVSPWGLRFVHQFFELIRVPNVLPFSHVHHILRWHGAGGGGSAASALHILGRLRVSGTTASVALIGITVYIDRSEFNAKQNEAVDTYVHKLSTPDGVINDAASMVGAFYDLMSAVVLRKGGHWLDLMMQMLTLNLIRIWEAFSAQNNQHLKQMMIDGDAHAIRNHCEQGEPSHPVGKALFTNRCG